MQDLRILIAGVVMLFATALLLADNIYAKPVAPHSGLNTLAGTEDLRPPLLWPQLKGVGSCACQSPAC